MKTSCHINPVWQRMRDDGMMVREIAAEAGLSMGTITRHTVPAHGKRISVTEKIHVIEWYEAGLELPEIARNSRLPKAVCETIIHKAIEDGTAAPRQAGCPTIPDITELVEKDNCPGRVLRGLTAEDYRRLIEVNKEYDRRRENKSDDN